MVKSHVRRSLGHMKVLNELSRKVLRLLESLKLGVLVDGNFTMDNVTFSVDPTMTTIEIVNLEDSPCVECILEPLDNSRGIYQPSTWGGR